MKADIKRLQEIELDILKQTLKIIEKHSLTYYMLGGTLLGAVRHNGFIPWDDDIDIGLPRPDYEKFLIFARKELNGQYRLNFIKENNSDYYYYYARIENTDTKLVRSSSLKKCEIYPWIDVFPLDAVPENSIERERWLKKCRRKQLIFNYSQFSYFGAATKRIHNKSFLQITLRNLFYKLQLEKLISTKRAWEKLDLELKKYGYDDCDTIINFCGHWGLKEMFNKAVYGKGKEYRFEDIILMGPENYDFVLTQLYGDYMTPPADKEKNQHYVEIIN